MDLLPITRGDPRDAWRHEALDFTPWLAREENFAQLAQTLHLDGAEVRGTEYAVGSFAADLVAEDRDGLILVENQIGPSDHGHLGQIMTYLAGAENVRKVVWITTRLREEHRAAFDWLNEATNDVDFFAVELELIRIGDGPAAALFHVVAKPNSWTRQVAKQARTASASASTEREAQYVEFWSALASHAGSRMPQLAGAVPAKGYYWGFGIGRTGFGLIFSASFRDEWCGVEIYINDDLDGAVIDGLRSAFAEHSFDAPLTPEKLIWDAGDGRKGSRIAVRKPNVDLNDRSGWPSAHEWMIAHAIPLREAFAPVIREIA